MKFICILITFATITTAIRVPTSWKETRKTENQYGDIENIEIASRSPYVLPQLDLNSATLDSRQIQSNLHKNIYGLPLSTKPYLLPPQTSKANLLNQQNDWVPIIPQEYLPIQVTTILPIFVPALTTQVPTINYYPKANYYKTYNTSSLNQNLQKKNVPSKRKNQSKSNYLKSNNSSRSYTKKPYRTFIQPNKINEPRDESEYISDHENPQEIPTKPIYPGKGQWAKRGRKYKPFHSHHKYTNLKDSGEKSDGYEIFENAQQIFDKHNSKFNDKIHNQDNRIKEEESSLESFPTEFTPIKMYAQVRKTETEEHLPSSMAEDERLKEVIKNSKIQTVYTEEGYEDEAYDHAGHEKHAETDEGSSKHDKKVATEPESESQEEEDGDTDQNEEDTVNRETITTYGKKILDKDPTPKSNNFIKTEHTKMTSVKQKDDGKIKMEVTDKIKVVSLPNNETKVHKFVKIIPKEISAEEDVDSTTGIEEVGTTEAVTVQDTEIKPESTKTTVVSSTVEPLTLNAIESINNAFDQIKVRKKRNVYPKTLRRSDTSNIYSSRLNTKKYPYYNINSEQLSANSPLRYAENMKNIPVKTRNNMAFYEQADQMPCPEVDSEVDPIPSKIQNAESEEIKEDENVQDKSPRLGNLGNKIDCFKRKYFGENPLDSPIFQEELVEPVTPPFKILHEKTGGFKSLATYSNLKEKIRVAKSNDLEKNADNKKYHSKFSLDNIKEQIKTNPDIATQAKIQNLLTSGKQEEIIFKSFGAIKEEVTVPNKNLGENILVDILDKLALENEDYNQKPTSYPFLDSLTTQATVYTTSEEIVTELPLAALITTPNYTINITPKHIYDQIDLLNYLPSQEANVETSMHNVNMSAEHSNMGVPLRTGKLLSATVKNPTNSVNYSNMPKLPDAEALRRRKRKRIPPRVPRPPIYVNRRYRQTTAPPFYYKSALTLMPKINLPLQNYHNKIQTAEQLAVFSDIINNIQNSSKDPDIAANTYHKPNVVPHSFNYQAPVHIHHIKYVEPDTTPKTVDDNIRYIMASSTTSVRTPVRGRTKFKDYQSEEDSEYISETVNQSNFGRRQKPKTTTTTSQPDVFYRDEEDDNVVAKTTLTEAVEYETQPEEQVIGLVPPAQWEYKTIFDNDEVKTQKDKPSVTYFTTEDEPETENQNFYIAGMKPPSSKQKVYSYIDFELLNNKPNKRRNWPIRRRGKRSASRVGYFEFSRQKGNNEETSTTSYEEDDDYVPHRSKNYYYDEKTKRIVYLKKPEVEKEEEEEYILEETLSTTAASTTRKPFKYLPKPEGPSYVDFVNVLKSHNNYVPILDPSTTEANMKENVTTQATTTQATASTKPPEFLSFVSKLRQSETYQMYEEKNKTKSTTTKPTTTTVEAEEEVEETGFKQVQNAPGGLSMDFGQNYQVFDISSYLPNTRNYSPKTSINYAKYKTIERPTSSKPKHNYSSRYNVDNEESQKDLKEDLEDQRKPEETVYFSTSTTTKTEETLPSVIPTTIPTTTTTKRIKNRQRTRPSTTTTSRSVSVSHSTQTAVHDKTKRVYPRRRPTRIRLGTTTTKYLEEDLQEKNSKIVKRRHQEDQQGDAKSLSMTNILTSGLNMLTSGSSYASSYNNQQSNKKKPEVTSVRTTNKNKEVISKIPEEQDEVEGSKKTEGVTAVGTIEVTKSEQSDSRLNDLLTNPDPDMPQNVNQLKEIEVDLLEDTSEENEEDSDYTNSRIDRDYFGGVSDNDNFDTETTKKPLFIKDPNKRLYYYAWT